MVSASSRYDLLNLPTMRVVSVDDRGSQYVVFAEAETAPDACPKCLGTTFHKHGSKHQVFVDLPCHGHFVTIEIDRKRFRCRSCGATTLQPLPDMALVDMEDTEERSGGAAGHLMTRRLVEQVSKTGLERTFAEVSRDTGLDEHTVRRIVADHVRDLEKRIVFETPDWLGLDEIHILGKVCGVVTNVERHCLVDILPRRDEEFLGGYMSTMRDADLIELVAIDMWRPYLRVAEAHLPNAKVVIDKFHVVRMANEVLDTVRKAAQRHLPTGERISLKNERGQLYRRAQRLDNRGRAVVDKWTQRIPLLEDVWLAKEGFFDIWDRAASSAEAMAMYDEWVAGLPAHLQEPFHPLTRALGNWREPIFRYFDNPVTNAYTEALNSVIRVINRVGRGYSFEVLRAKMLYAHGQHVLDGRKLDRRRKVACHRSGPFTPENSMVWGVDLKELAALIEKGDI